MVSHSVLCRKSKVWLNTPALGWLSFYLLDGGAEMTPLLLGARDMRKRGAVISCTMETTWLTEAKQVLGMPVSCLHLVEDI